MGAPCDKPNQAGLSRKTKIRLNADRELTHADVAELSASLDNPFGSRLSPMSWVRPVTYVSGLDDGFMTLGAGAGSGSRRHFRKSAGSRRPRFSLGFSNELDRIALSNMPKESPVTGPMITQPVERASNVPTPVLPMMPSGGKLKKAPQPRQKTTTRTEAVRVAKAKITRRNSLRKQRQALKG
jgi:hypothetical protein